MTTCTRASQTKSRSSLTVVHQVTSSPSQTSSLSADAGRSIPSRTNNAPKNEFSTTEQFSVLTKQPSQNPSDPTHHPPTFTELCSTCHGYKPAVDQTDYHSAVEAQRESGGHHHRGLPRALRRAISQLASSLNGKEYYRHVDKNGRRRLPVIRESEERSDLTTGDTNGGNNARTGADPGSLKLRESAGSLPLSDQSGEKGRRSERRRGRACTKRASERNSYQARNRPEYADEGSLSSHHNCEYFRPADVLCIPLQSGYSCASEYQENKTKSRLPFFDTGIDKGTVELVLSDQFIEKLKQVSYTAAKLKHRSQSRKRRPHKPRTRVPGKENNLYAVESRGTAGSHVRLPRQEDFVQRREDYPYLERPPFGDDRSPSSKLRTSRSTYPHLREVKLKESVTASLDATASPTKVGFLPEGETLHERSCPLSNLKTPSISFLRKIFNQQVQLTSKELSPSTDMQSTRNKAQPAASNPSLRSAHHVTPAAVLSSASSNTDTGQSYQQGRPAAAIPTSRAVQNSPRRLQKPQLPRDRKSVV